MIRELYIKYIPQNIREVLFLIKKAIIVLAPTHLLSRFEVNKVDKVDYTPSVSWGGWRLNEERSNLKEHAWRERTEAMVSFIDFENVRSVMDLGAGGQHLRGYIPKGIEYVPVDIKERFVHGEGTLLANFNNKEFPERNADCMFCAGILEYMEYPQWWISNVCLHCDKEIVISYHCAKIGCDIKQRYLEGWVNHITENKLKDIFLENGFALIESKYMGWHYGTIFKFAKH